MKDVFPAPAKQYVVRIDIEAAFREQDAHPQIVAAHCRVSAARECVALLRAVPISNVRGRRYVVKHSELEALVAKPVPTVETCANIFRYVIRVVPVPYQCLGNESGLGWAANAESCEAVKLLQREVSDEGRSQAIVILEADWVRIHIVHVLAEVYRSDWSILPTCPFPGVKRGVNAP
ncbi:hypothetical protein R75461_03633 [Paraburkholderia nemoris]|nr:hypothetical protein R75461_03633 [Paraburkholderia nemoris]